MTQEDKFIDDGINLLKSMIIKETQEYLIINKPCNISSQGGDNQRLNLPSLVSLYLHGAASAEELGEDAKK